MLGDCPSQGACWAYPSTGLELRQASSLGVMGIISFKLSNKQINHSLDFRHQSKIPNLVRQKCSNSKHDIERMSLKNQAYFSCKLSIKKSRRGISIAYIAPFFVCLRTRKK
jgi:hypothetical protein